MPLTSLVVVVPVNQQSVSPKKGRRLLLIHLLETKTLLNEGSFFRSWFAARIRVYRRCVYYLNCWVLLLVVITIESELEASVGERSIVVVFCPYILWTFSIASSGFLMIHELWLSKNDMWERLSILAGTILIICSPMLLYWWVWSCILCWKEDEGRLFTGDYVHE